ncbi:MAG TPA: DUF397 domain-containing protein [Kineosporiaceae bacterium]|nr:DUF397 domain-containing protein [Kineosporiaceae bacterium]
MITGRGCDPARSWIKASLSSNAANCVEMRRSAVAGVDVRDSKNPDGAVLSFSAAQFTAWLDGADGGEFDHLIH